LLVVLAGYFVAEAGIALADKTQLSESFVGGFFVAVIVNLPGKKSNPPISGCGFPAIPYCIALLEGPFLECNEDVMQAFRPKQL
jgi:hypothetical protein